MRDSETPPADPAGAARNEPGLEEFTAWFRANYPGPDTVISNPDWHAPKVFRAVLRCLPVAPPASEAGHREDSDEGLVREFENALGREDRILWRGDTEEGEAASESDHQKAKADVGTSKAALLARLRQLRADGELYRRMLDQSNATLDAEGRRVGIEMGCDTAHWMAEEILGLRAHGERLRASNHRLAGVLLGEVQRAREEAAREERERCAKIVEAEPELPDAMPDAMWDAVKLDREVANEAFRITVRLTKDNILAAIRRQLPGAGTIPPKPIGPPCTDLREGYPEDGKAGAGTEGGNG